MDPEMIVNFKSNKGFIAALDQSGGSSAKTLKLYGINEDQYKSEEEMFQLIHEMRTRILTSKSFKNEQIMGVILFEETMNRKIENKYTSNYLLEEKNIISFLKIDKGLEKKQNGVQLMKPISNLEELLNKAKDKNIFGTKMRSVIYENNKEGISQLVEQQFTLAKTIFDYGLIPIIEPEVSIDSIEKTACETTLKEEIDKQLKNLPNGMNIILKLTLPNIDNFYEEYVNDDRILKVVALSGGYTRKKACKLLSKNKGVVASFSRALLEGLNINQTNDDFDNILKNNIDEIYNASVNKE